MDGYATIDPSAPENTLDIDATLLEHASVEFLGRWNRLVSTTNWEKGRIISQWRQNLLTAGAPIQFCSDDAWSRRVGNVSPQHVGRLRRTYEQFGETYEQYPGLFWSHFQAAVDWPDAEMWLEGARLNGWSVALMRRQRWQTMGAVADQEPHDADVVDAEPDEDGPPTDSVPDTIAASQADVQTAEDDDVPFDAPAAREHDADEEPADAADDSSEPVRPFENLPALPDDLHDAFETFKLAILNHKLSGWREISREEILAVLDGLKQLVCAPAEA